MIKRLPYCTSVFAVAALLSIPAAISAAPRSDISWGKPGVSFDTYRRDAMECGIGGAKADIANRQDTRDVLDGTHNQDKDIDRANARSAAKGSGRLDPEELNQMIRDYSHTYQRSIRGGVTRTQGFMEDTVTACLRARGYTPFRLTKAQVRARDRLHTGTLERRRYLYTLASNPAILRDQAANEDRKPIADTPAQK